MEAVTSAIASTTETIMKSIKTDLETLELVKEETAILKREMMNQKAEAEKLDQYSRKDNIKNFWFN